MKKELCAATWCNNDVVIFKEEKAVSIGASGVSRCRCSEMQVGNVTEKEQTKLMSFFRQLTHLRHWRMK